MRCLLLSTVSLLVVPTLALAAPDFISHTHTTPIELKSISSSSGLKLAGVCFLGYGDCSDGGFGSIDRDDGYTVDTEKQCQNEGYTITSCSLPSYPSGQCPYNDQYFAKCVEDRPRACNETGFTETQCSSGMVVDTTCSYDANYKKCKCDPCSGYDYTYAQATAQGYVADGSCQSCSETKYKRKENPCSGYITCECGGEIGSAVCYSGSTQKFKSCKKCCDDTCPSGEKNVSCASGYHSSFVGLTECGTSCYICESDCDNSCQGSTFISETQCSSFYSYISSSLLIYTSVSTSSDGCGNTCYTCCASYYTAYDHPGYCYCKGKQQWTSIRLDYLWANGSVDRSIDPYLFYSEKASEEECENTLEQCNDYYSVGRYVNRHTICN